MHTDMKFIGFIGFHRNVINSSHLQTINASWRFFSHFWLERVRTAFIENGSTKYLSQLNSYSRDENKIKQIKILMMIISMNESMFIYIYIYIYMITKSFSLLYQSYRPPSWPVHCKRPSNAKMPARIFHLIRSSPSCVPRNCSYDQQYLYGKHYKAS